jgi:hypothetical protein
VAAEATWTVDAPAGSPIAWIGLRFEADERLDGSVYLDYLTWDGEPDVVLGRPDHGGSRWLGVWTRACSVLSADPDGVYRVIQNEGRGLVIQGTREWRDYTVEATLTANLARSMGVATRVQGLQRYYALELCEQGVRLVRERHGRTVLAQAPYAWELYMPCTLTLSVEGSRLRGAVNGEPVLEIVDDSDLHDGAVAVVLEEGRIGCSAVTVRPNR